MSQSVAPQKNWSASRLSGFFRGLAIQVRVIGALMMQEIYSRYGRESLGFAWVFAEPLLFVFPVLTMWHFIRPRYASGDLLWADVSWSGYLPLMLYRHLGGLAVGVIRMNGYLFYHRVIHVYDIMLSRIAVEVLSNIAAALFSLFGLIIVGEMAPPADWHMLFIGYFYMIWWCAAIAMLVSGLSELTVWIEKAWMVLGYMYIAVSGCFFLADWLPPPARKLALFQPSLQAYEMIRCGVFGDKVPTYFDYTYETMILAILTLVGLAGVRIARQRLQIA